MGYEEILKISKIGDRISSFSFQEKTIYSHVFLKTDYNGGFNATAFIKGGGKHDLFKCNTLNRYEDWYFVDCTEHIRFLERDFKYEL